MTVSLVSPKLNTVIAVEQTSPAGENTSYSWSTSLVRVASCISKSVAVAITADGQVQVDMSVYNDPRITSCGVEFYEL